MDAHKQTKETFDNVQSNYNGINEQINKAQNLINNLTSIIKNTTASPEEIEFTSREILKMDLTLEPDEIKHLANRIDQTVLELENVESIIANTKGDLEDVENLKQAAIDAK